MVTNRKTRILFRASKMVTTFSIIFLQFLVNTFANSHKYLVVLYEHFINKDVLKIRPQIQALAAPLEVQLGLGLIFK